MPSPHPALVIAWIGSSVSLGRLRECWLRANFSEATMDRTIAELNVARFRKLFSSGVDPIKWHTLERLLVDELTKLDHVQAAKRDSSDRA